MRVADIAFSVMLLILAAVPMGLIALWIRLDSKGPVIYRQERLGQFFKPFIVYKFRTMQDTAEGDIPQLSYPGDKRVTRAGRFLRRYHLDELPQLWNVMCGDMSLIGPRPERAYYVGQLLEIEPKYKTLFRVRPGLSSPGTVYFGYASTIEEMARRSRIDADYVTHMTVYNYFRLLWATILTVVKGRGV